jgi:hypothetical protein
MGKSKKNRNKDRRSFGAYYDDHESDRQRKNRKKNRHTHNHDYPKREFDDWETL